MTNKNTFAMHRPKPRAIFTLSAGLICSGLSVLIIVFTAKQDPAEITDKILNCLLFIVVWCFGLLSAAMSVSAVRDLLSRPTVTLYSDKLVFHDGTEILFEEIKSMDQIKKSLGNSKLILTLKNDAEVSIKQKTIDIPLQTLKWAVETRTNDLSADNNMIGK